MKTTSSYLATTKFPLSLQRYKYCFTPATSGLTSILFPQPLLAYNKYSFTTASSGLQVFFLAKASSGFDLNTKLRNYRFWAITESASTQRGIYNDFYTRKAYMISKN